MVGHIDGPMLQYGILGIAGDEHLHVRSRSVDYSLSLNASMGDPTSTLTFFLQSTEAFDRATRHHDLNIAKPKSLKTNPFLASFRRILSLAIK